MNDKPTDAVTAWMATMGFALTFDTGLKSYYSKTRRRIINAEAATFFYNHEQQALQAARKQAASDIFNLAHNYAQDDTTMVGAENLRTYRYYKAISRIGGFDER